MSFRKENAARQTEFRLAALENGWTPTPNHHKHCYLKGWATLQPTPEDIADWGEKLVYQATGILVRDGLCAIDMDIDDAEMQDRIWDRVVGQFPQIREALVRSGSGEKEAWFLRTDEVFSVIHSTLHVKPGEDPEETGVVGHRMEAFGGGHARQMGAFGAHTMLSDNSGFKVEYKWLDDESPAEVRLDALPVLPKSAVFAIAQIVGEELDAAGWPRVKHSREGEATGEPIYDLMPDMRFNCLDGVTRNLEQLASYAEGNANARCSASWTGDATMVNRTRCLISLDHTGEVCVLETANWSRHQPAALRDRARTLSERSAGLGDKLRGAGFEFDFEEYNDAPASFQETVHTLLDEWAWCGARSRPCLPIYRPEELSMPLQNLRTTYLQYAYEREGPRGGVVSINPVDAWAKHCGRQDVDGYRFMPDKPQGIFAQGNIRAINSYQAPVREPLDDAKLRAQHVQLWEDFLVHLLPDDAERTWFSDWLAHKKQNLTVPGVAVIMYAAPFGVGRGTLIEFLGGVFGDAYVRSVPGDFLMGIGQQSQYTDWMADALFVTSDEILPDGEDGSSMAWRRKKAYENLKERIDPKPRRMNIVRKGLPNYQDFVYATFLLATNHHNAIPIPPHDRRLVVLTNGRVPLAQDEPLINRINAIRNPGLDQKFITAISDWLDERDVSHFNAQVAPAFGGKEQMHDANISEFDSVVDAVLDDVPFEWATLDTLLSRVEDVLTRTNHKQDYPYWRRQATARIEHKWEFMTRAYMDRDRRVRRAVYIRTPVGREKFLELSTEERAISYGKLRKSDVIADPAMRALRAGLSIV